MASSLVDSMTGDFDPEEFEDDYREAVERLVEAKLAGGDVRDVPAPAREDTGGQVVDLMAALQRSVDAARAGRGQAPAEATEAKADERAGEPAQAEESEGAEKAAPAKRSTAKRAPAAKKTAAKKSAPADTAAKKTSAASKSATAKSTTTKKAAKTTKKAASRRTA